MAPKLLSGLAKMMAGTKPKKSKGKRHRRKSSISKIATVATVANKPSLDPAALGNSCSTCASSGYFNEQPPPASLSPTATTVTASTTTKSPTEEDASSTWCGSDSDNGPGSPLLSRPSTTMRRSKSHGMRMTLPHHNKSLSFRLRKRNRALSDVDFDQLLTMSRGWTFDPSSNSRTRHHTRQKALGQTDFERYIFAPTPTTTMARRSTTVAPMPPACCVDMSTRSVPFPGFPVVEEASCSEDETTVHPFFRPLERCCI